MTTNLKQERINREWTLEYVGQQINVTNQAVHLIETLKSKPSYDVLIKLEDLFGLSHRYLLAQAGDDSQSDYTNSEEKATDVSANLEEGERAIRVLGMAAEIANCHRKVSLLMKDYGLNGQVNSEEFRPFFKELREVANDAFV